MDASKNDALERHDNLSDGIFNLLHPILERLNGKLENVRATQSLLDENILRLIVDLRELHKLQDIPIPLDSYIKKLQLAKRKISSVNTILQNSKDRLEKLHQNIATETRKKKNLT
ncbi:SNARE-associated protein Snapin [Trichoplax sp. H2]|nr:SNARE-associated protein Snapin [Trichoplax sp. H2]|eukprot:RDD43939.1 SNARE-associated protein Snapin [Trichoplax sp. H2]